MTAIGLVLLGLLCLERAAASLRGEPPLPPWDGDDHRAWADGDHSEWGI